MKLALKVFGIALLLGLVFALEFALFGEALELRLGQGPSSQWFAASRPLAWLLGIALLLSDLLLPIPASGVMAGLGAVYGVWLGAGISLMGSAGAGFCGYLLARFAGRRWLHLLATEEEIARFRWFFDQWGGWAIIASRMLPVLPEVITILAGLARMRLSRFSLALVLGTMPAALFFAAIGFSSRATPWYGMALASVLPLALWPLFLRVQQHAHRGDYPSGDGSPP